jgi:hypothetical protein
MEDVKMHYAKTLIPMTLLAAAATIAGVACSDKADSGEGRSQSAQSEQNADKANRGVLKIQDLVGNKETPDNDPHVGCRFQIEFRGFDKDEVAKWTLSAQPPSGDKDLVITSGEVQVGEDDASGGATDLDAIVKLDLSQLDISGLEEHKIQGFHLRAEAEVIGQKGGPGVKSKVFWATSCEEAPPPPPPEDGGGSSSSGGSSSGGSSSGGSSSGGGKAW